MIENGQVGAGFSDRGKYPILVVGAGSWGTAIAHLLNINGHQVCLWSYDKNIISQIRQEKTNNTYLKGVSLEGIEFSSDPKNFEKFEYIVNVVPTKFILPHYKSFNLNISDKYIINCSKGIENSTGRRISEIFEKEFLVPASHYGDLTGPSHAEEVARQSITSVLAASQNPELSKKIQCIFSNHYFRVYTSKDVVGAELGGALKNVIAVAAGILDGLEMGDNAKAALITRGLAELLRFGLHFGAEPLTFSGLSGLGDLIVTCTSEHSRNRRLGVLIGKGGNAEEIVAKNVMVSEGYYTAKAIYSTIKKLNIQMPISEEVYYILYEGKNPLQSMRDLMEREYKSELY